MNKILCFDVSGNRCSVAISKGKEILFFEQEMRPSMQAEVLMVIIERGLKKANISYKDIDYLAVTTGPGSFTSIRIGLAVAKAILYATNIKPVALTNFETSHYRLRSEALRYDSAFVILNAYRNQLYVQKFINNIAYLKPMLMDNIDVINILKQEKGNVVCAGSGLIEIYSEIKDFDNLMILPRFPYVKAYHTIGLVNDKINANEINLAVEPLYIRPPDAIAPRML